MKKYLSYFFVLILFSVATFSIAVCDDEIPAIRVGVYENVPKIFTNEEGVVTGFWPDLVKYISTQEGWQIEWVPGTWAQCLKKLKTGEINILPDTGWTEPRSREYTFSNETVLVSWSRLYVPKKSKINSIIDLNGKTIAGLKGSFNLEGPEGLRQILHKFNLKATIKEMESYEQVFEALQKGKIDAGITNKDFGNLHESHYAVERTSIIFQPARMQFAFTKNAELTPFLIKKIDIHMKQLQENENSIYYKALEQYIGGKPAKTFIKIIPEWIKMTFVVGCGVILFLFAVGITSRRQVRQKTFELQKSEKKYRHLFQNAPAGIYEIDFEKVRFINVNEVMCKYSGYSEKEFLSMNPMDLLTEDSKNLFIGRLENFSTEENQIDSIEYNIIKKNGQELCVILNNDYIYKNEKLTGARVVVHDITELKKAQEEKIKAQKIAGEQKKLALVGQVAGKMAHDFNNILGIIMGNTELSLLDCKEEETKKTLELIFEQTIRGKNLTKNLVAFAKDQEPKQEFFRISEKIDLVLSLLKKDLQGIELIKEDKAEVPNLLADPGMIEHAFVNLIQNSIHAVSLVEHPRIINRIYSLDDNICIDIEDNGCGISKKHLENIFEPSFTLKGSKDTTGSYERGIKGTGYGMANVKKYIEQHKGSISVESEFGSGTKFTIRLPVIKKELTKQEKAEIQKENIYFDKYILLVEDEPAISGVQYRLLSQEPCNHKVDIANDGQVAIDLFKRNEYDLISLDYVLPGGINGMDVYDHVRKTNKTIPILFISGNIEFLESIKELKQKDANIDHLSKPCQNKDYVKSINELFARDLASQE